MKKGLCIVFAVVLLILGLPAGLSEALSWLTASPEEELGYIYAPSTGRCTLRSGPSNSSRALMQCKTGVIVTVLESDQWHTKVDYQGIQGYVINGCVSMYSYQDRIAGTGVLHLRGNTDGRNLINIRSAARKDAAIVAKWPTGMEALVFDPHNSSYVPEGWVEIEAEGLHGYVMAEYILVTIPDHPRYWQLDMTEEINALGAKEGDITWEGIVSLTELPLRRLSPEFREAESPWKPEGNVLDQIADYPGYGRCWHILWRDGAGNPRYQAYVNAETGKIMHYQQLYQE